MKKFLINNLKIGILITLAVSIFGVAVFSIPKVINADIITGTCDTQYTQAVFNPYNVTWGQVAGCVDLDGDGSPEPNDFAVLSGGVKDSGNGWAGSFNAQVGDIIHFMVYVHNGASSNSGAMMHSVSYETILDTSPDGSTQTITTTLRSTDSGVSSKQGVVVVNTPVGSELKSIQVAGKINDPMNGTIGDLQPCFEYVKFFDFYMEVIAATPLPTNTPPRITLIGDNPFNITVGDVFADPGATAYDDEEGDLTASIATTTNLNTSIVGNYFVEYSVSDIEGLSATTTREVIVNPTGTPILPTLNLNANPLIITTGDSSTLSWNSTNAESCSAVWTSSTATSGSMVISPTTTADYTMTCQNTDGSVTATTTITVNPIIPPNTPFVTLSANPQTITEGDSSLLSWVSQNVSSCSASWTVSTSTSGTQSISPVSTTEYSILCTGNNGNVSATTTVTVNPKVVPPIDPPPVTPPSGGGGGGGGNPGGHRRDISNLLAPQGEVLSASSCMYLWDHLKMGWDNDKIEVLKLQSFLNVFEGENLSYTGIFDQTTFDAVARFQTKYAEDILEPWGPNVTKGFVYILTKKKINEIYCSSPFPVTSLEQNEIDTFRALGVSSFSPSGDDSSLSSLDDGISDNIEDVLYKSPIVELKDISTTKTSSIVGNVAISLFALPQKILSNGRYLTIVLILIAMIVAIISLFISKKDSENFTPTLFDDKEKNKKKEKEELPIILPGETVFPDEEIIVEDPEKEEEIN